MKEFCDYSCDMAQFCSSIKDEAGEAMMQFIEATGEYREEVAAKLSKEGKTADEIEAAVMGIWRASSRLRQPFDDIRLPAREFLGAAEVYCFGPDDQSACGMSSSREFRAANEMRHTLRLTTEIPNNN